MGGVCPLPLGVSGDPLPQSALRAEVELGEPLTGLGGGGEMVHLSSALPEW